MAETTAVRAPAAPAGASPAWLIATLVAIGIALRVWQYLGDTSLWFDELSIARNIHQRSFAQLMTQPLAYDQIAPLGFLAVVKGSTLLIGPSDMALRLFPFLCGLLSLILFWRVAVRALDPIAAPIALGLFALGLAFILYSTILKQYGSDIAATLALTAIALELRASPPNARRCTMAGVAGLVVVWFSQAAMLVMAVLGAILAGCWLLGRDRSARLPTLITVPIWAASALIGFSVARLHVTPQTLAYMHHFWRQRMAFFPLPPRHPGDLLWLWNQVLQLFEEDTMLRYPAPWLYEAIAILGLVVLWRRRRDVGLIVSASLVGAVAAAVTQQYPFRLRVALYVIPGLVLLVAAGIGWIGVQASRLHPLLGLAALGALIAPPVFVIIRDPPPYFIEDYKTVLAHVEEHRRQGDPVYVYSYAHEAMAHYGPRYGLGPGEYTLGICDERENRRYLEDVDRFRGLPRVWVILASVPPFYPPRQSLDQYLHAIGIVRDSIAVRSRQRLSPVSAELFDLSDSVRLGATTAATSPVTPINDTLPPHCSDRVRPAADPPPRPDTVIVRSGALDLRALLWRPQGNGPFPAVLFNHGSGHAISTPSGQRDQQSRVTQAMTLGPVFARHGYVFLFLFRRGAGLSAGQGTYSGDRMDSAFAAAGQDGRNQVQVEILEGDETNDALAALAFLRSRPDVDPRRVAIGGHSFGGALTLLVAERDSTLEAAIDFAGAANSWVGSPPLRERLLTAVRRTTVPVFFMHAANDYSVEPGKSLAAAMERAGKPHRLAIYPAVGHSRDEGHSFVYLNVAAWERDVFAFLDARVRP